jgi:apolipoprotein N-acyltransferase
VLVIWPETATGSYLRRQPDQQIAVSRFAATTGVPVFTGYADYDFTPEGTARSFNSAAIFGPSGPGERYAKRHLVPFGERMPFQGLIPALGKLELGQAEWTPGERPVVFESAAGPFSCLICFESIFPDHTRRNVLRGARWIVNVTNDEWFGDSAALRQHAAMARVRAIENHVPLARCANTGLTQMIDPLGRVSAQAPAFRQAVLAGVVPPPGPPTLFTRAGDWPGILAAICFGVLALRSLLLGRAR